MQVPVAHARGSGARRRVCFWTISVAAALVAFALVGAACGDTAPSSSPSSSPMGGDPLAGHWRVSGEAALHVAGGQDFFIAVAVREGGYSLGVDGRPPEPAILSNDRIVLPYQSCTGTPAEFGLDGSRPAVFAFVNPTQSPAAGEPGDPSWRSFAVERLTADDYAAEAAVKADATMRVELASMRILLRTWAKDNGRLPRPAEMSGSSAFGRWAAGLGVWPANPYTGEPMTAGTRPGQFAYAVEDEGFTLTGYLRDGASFLLQSE